MFLKQSFIFAAFMSSLWIKPILLLFKRRGSTSYLHTQLLALGLLHFFVLKHLFLLEAHIVAACIKVILHASCVQTEGVVRVFVVVVDCRVRVSNAAIFLTRSGFPCWQVFISIVVRDFLSLVMSGRRTVASFWALLASACGSVIDWASMCHRCNSNLNSAI